VRLGQDKISERARQTDYPVKVGFQRALLTRDVVRLRTTFLTHFRSSVRPHRLSDTSEAAFVANDTMLNHTRRHDSGERRHKGVVLRMDEHAIEQSAKYPPVRRFPY
jgi:hypothetical protein